MKEWARAVFGAAAEEELALREAIADEISYDRAGLRSWIQSLGPTPVLPWDRSGEGEDDPDNIKHVVLDALRKHGAENPAAVIELAHQAYWFGTGVFDPVPFERRATVQLVAAADGQVELEDGDGG